jgi:hypothetical protein
LPTFTTTTRLAEFTAFLQAEPMRWGKVINDLKIKME